jgi:hypothetical protein
MDKKIIIPLAAVVLIAGIISLSNSGKNDRAADDVVVANKAKIEYDARVPEPAQVSTGADKNANIGLASSSRQNNDEVTRPKKTQPATDGKALESCANGAPCAEGFICYHSQFAGMGPNGVVNGKEEGDLLCHKACANDNECGVGKCQTVEIFAGDVATLTKFCSIN